MISLRHLHALWIVALLALSQLRAQDNDPILVVINGEKITKSEFLSQFNRNNTKDRKATKEEIEEYLQLFINYKLKLADARAKGFDTLQNYKQELKTYRTQLAEPYLNDAEITKELLDEAYLRMQKWVQASHILISIDHPAAPEDTLRAYKKAMDIYNRLQKGESFEKLATEFSDDPSAKDQKLSESQGGAMYIGNKGYLGYFNGSDMVYEFENACFTLSPGEISLPVRTPFGYHIIKLINRKPALFHRADVAHIWIGIPKHDSAEAKKLIDTAYEELLAGVSFADVATKYSEEPKSKTNQGLIAGAKVFSLPPQYVEQLSSLEIGQYSKPFQTSWGWHIVMPKRYYPLPSLANMEQEITQIIARDKRSFRSQASFAEKMKKEYGYTAYPKNLEEVIIALTDTAFFTQWRTFSDHETFVKPLFSIGQDTLTQAMFIEYVQLQFYSSQNKQSTRYSYPVVQNIYENWETLRIVSYAEKRLESKFPEFKRAINDYSDGILLFNISNAMVWEKSAIDSIGLSHFYNQHKHEYLWEKRADATVWTIDNNVLDGKTAEKIIAKGYKKGQPEEKILSRLMKKARRKCADPNKYIHFKWGKFEAGDNLYVDKVSQVGVAKAQIDDNKITIVALHQILPPEIKTLDECRGRAISEYQKELETKWIQRIRANYPVLVHKDVVRSLY